MTLVQRSAANAGVAATLAAAILWGSSFHVNDVGLRHVGPGAFVFLRFLLAALLALGALALLRRARLDLLPHRWFWALCAMNASAFLLQYIAQTMTTPARTALFVNTSAIFVALLEAGSTRTPLGGARWLAVGLGVTGTSILIVGGDIASLTGGRLLGDVLALASGAVWSVFFWRNGRAVAQEDPIHLAAWTFAGTAVFLAPAVLLDPWLSLVPNGGITAGGLAAIVYTGLFTTALAFGLWTWGLARVRASMSAVLLLVEVLVAALVSVAVGREGFSAIEIFGALILGGALMLAARSAE